MKPGFDSTESNFAKEKNTQEMPQMMTVKYTTSVSGMYGLWWG